jgi:hypothetical protein
MAIVRRQVAFVGDVRWRVRCGEVERRSSDGGPAAREPTRRELTIPLVNIVPVKPGLMRGERLFNVPAMLC